MMYTFSAYGHRNILATHRTTLEFTKEKELSLKGDCIVGVDSDFDNETLKHFIKSVIEKNNKKIRIIIKIKNNGKYFTKEFNAALNPSFNDEKEIVIRKSDFISSRTFAIKSEKAAGDFGKDFVRMIKEPSSRIIVVISAA